MVDFNLTYAPVGRHTSVRILIYVAAVKQCPLRQIDVGSAFLYAPIDAIISVEQLHAFEDADGAVCLLKKSLYWIKQAPRLGQQYLYIVLTELEFTQLSHDLGMYRKESRGKFILLVAYVDNLLYTGDDTELLDQFEADIKEKLEVTINHNFSQDLPVLCLHSDRGGEHSSGPLGEFCREEGITQSFTLLASLHQNGITEHRIGLVMEVARTSMTHAAFPHFQWSFAVRYAAHQLYLWPCVAEPESLLTLRWTGEVGDALAFWFYHLTTRGILSSQDVTFDESVCYYHLLPHVSFLVPPPPLFLVQGYPKVDSGAGSVGGTGAGGTRARGTGVGGTGAGGIGGSSAGGAAQPVQRRPFFWPQLQSLLPPPGSALRQSQPQLLPDSPSPASSPYTEYAAFVMERSKHTSRPASQVHDVCRARRVCPLLVRSTHTMALHLARPASPSVIRCLATRVNDPTFESAAASAFVAELLDFNAASCLDYFANLVSDLDCPPFVGGELAIGTIAVVFFRTFPPTPKKTTLQVLLHVAALRDYELHSLDFSTASLQGSLHEEI
ncbi:unnamed protein product [Closterium sp. NIES-53]